MALSFNKVTADKIVNEHLPNMQEFVYAYGTKSGFSLIVPKQVFIVFDGKDFTIFKLSAFHKVKETEKIALSDVANFKFNKGLTGGGISFKVAGKKARYEFQKNLMTLKDQHRAFLAKMETIEKQF